MSCRRSVSFLVLALAGCRAPEPAPVPTAEAALELTILYTADEHGWIAAKDDRYAHIGGASQLIALLQAREGHCAGTFDADGQVIRPHPENCAAPRTVLLSGGDNYSGPSISTFFRGRTMAQVMRLAGYQASAFGNHELDFGKETLVENRASAGIRYLSANLVTTEGKPSDLAAPWVILERNGVHLGVVGVSTESTIASASPHRFAGLRFDPIESTLARVVPELWREPVDAVVLLAHECHDIIMPIVRRHPEWKLSFVGTGHCHRSAALRLGDAVLIAPDWALSHYGRVRLAIHRDRPAMQRAEVVDYGLIDVSTPLAGPPASADAAFDREVAGWQNDIDRQLGEVIGFSSGLAASSDEMGRWITGSWLAAFPDAAVALTTKGGIRQDLPAGPITLATVQSILPFDNDLVIVEIPARELPALLAQSKAIASGLACDKNRCTKQDGSAIDTPTVRLVTTDYLYYGGDGFRLERFDANARFTGVDWKKPVIDWTRAAHSTAEAPIERQLTVDAGSRTRASGSR